MKHRLHQSNANQHNPYITIQFQVCVLVLFSCPLYAQITTFRTLNVQNTFKVKLKFEESINGNVDCAEFSIFQTRQAFWTYLWKHHLNFLDQTVKTRS